MSLRIEYTTESHLANAAFFDDWKLKMGLHYFEMLQVDSTFRISSWRNGAKRRTARLVINEENLATLNRLSDEFKMKPTTILIVITNDMYLKRRRYSLPAEICAPEQTITTKEITHENA
ncbi:hypothetical protein [Vibrio scophthalmi]|uniref:Uncharacterized protein n=1 Tax=Vibrio scophthalmi TaxID=45658 RepID=A0A1E3WIY6_9VIBR|nr:hypothetical protein [Vibrio scophthalmi]ODS09695.1 hypothetical protein VSF3289_03258 [Vibrio scophthalmi]